MFAVVVSLCLLPDDLKNLHRNDCRIDIRINLVPMTENARVFLAYNHAIKSRRRKRSAVIKNALCVKFVHNDIARLSVCIVRENAENDSRLVLVDNYFSVYYAIPIHDCATGE